MEEERRGNDVLKRQNETLKETLADIRRQMSMLGKCIYIKKKRKERKCVPRQRGRRSFPS